MPLPLMNNIWSRLLFWENIDCPQITIKSRGGVIMKNDNRGLIFHKITTKIIYILFTILFFVIMLGLFRVLDVPNLDMISMALYYGFTALSFFSIISAIRGTVNYIKDYHTNDVIEITGELIHFSSYDGNFILNDKYGQKHYLSLKNIHPDDIQFFKNISQKGSSCRLTVYVRKRTGFIASYKISD